MATNQERLARLAIGLHSSAADWETFPSSTVDIDPDQISKPEWTYVNLPINPYRGDGEGEPGINGAKAASIPLDFVLRGVNSGAGDGVSTSAATKMDAIRLVLEALTGSAVSDDSGDTTDGVDAGTGTTVTMDGAAGNTDGNAILVKGATSGLYQAREVVSTSGADVTVCRALTSGGGADTADEGEVAYASASWYLDADLGDHKHLGVDYEEDDGTRRQLYAGLGNGVFRLTGGAKLLFNTNLVFSDWEDVASGLSAYSAPTRGDPTPVIDAPFWMGSSEYLAYGHEIDLGLQLSPRTSDNAPNGFYGHRVFGFNATWKFKILRGGLTREANEALLNTLQARATTQDLLLQVGRTPGACWAFRAPAADIMAKEIVDNGQTVIECTAELKRSGNHSNVPGALRIHAF